MTSCCLALQRPGWPPGARRSVAAWRPRHRAAVAAQAARRQQPSGGSGSEGSHAMCCGHMAGPMVPAEAAVAAAAAELQEQLKQQQAGISSAEQQALDNMSSALQAAETDPAAIAAARQRLAVYLQQQDGISQAEATRLAGELSARLGAAADQLVPLPLQWFASRGMRPVMAARLMACMCASGNASKLRQWSTWQPVFATTWPLVDSCLAAYQQECKAAKRTPLKHSDSMAVLLSGQPSLHNLLVVSSLSSKLSLLQQQLALTDAQLGELIPVGLQLSGSQATMAGAMQWLVSFSGSQEAAVAMLRRDAQLLRSSAATLDSRVAALEAAWAGVLQPGQVRQLVQRSPKVLTNCKLDQYAPTAAVLSSWFPRPAELLAVLQGAPILLSAPAASLQANERWLTGPPLSLSRQRFLALVAARPKAWFGNLAEGLTQRKLAFLTQVGSVPLERTFSESQLDYLHRSITALAGRYFLLTEHGVPVHRHADGGIRLSYVIKGLRALLQRMRPHDSAGRLPADDDEAVEYLRQWLAAWPESDSGRRWYCRKASKNPV